jgi:hypothetical protein
VAIAAFLLATPAGRFARVAGAQDATDPWEALERLYPVPAAGRPGWSFLAAAAKRRAVENDLLLRVQAGWEPAHGPGVRVGGALDRAAGAREANVALVARDSRWRAAMGAAVLGWRGIRAASVDGALHVVALSGVLAGAEVRAWPREPSWAPETAWSLHVARGRWWGGAVLRSGSHRFRAAMGSAWTDGLAWFVAYEDGNPSAGITLALGGFELRAVETAHAVLGSVSEVVLCASRRPS